MDHSDAARLPELNSPRTIIQNHCFLLEFLLMSISSFLSKLFIGAYRVGHRLLGSADKQVLPQMISDEIWSQDMSVGLSARQK